VKASSKTTLATFTLIAFACSAIPDVRAQTPPSVDTVRTALRQSNWTSAKSDLDALVQARDLRAMVLLGELHFTVGGVGPFAEDPDLACGQFERVAALNNGDALYALAQCFTQGRGRPEDHAQARTLLQRATDKGSARAWCGLGRQYFEGQGVPVDGSQGVAQCRQGSSMGDGDADAEIGLRYLEGRGLTQSIVDARPWLDRGAQRGNAKAARALADVYWNGTGVPRDRAQAARYLEQAAKAGDMDAASRLARYRQSTAFDPSGSILLDRRGGIDAIYWLTAVSRLHPDPRTRKVAGAEVQNLREHFVDITMQVDHRLQTDPPRAALP